jgi:hypothetical protein
MKYFFPLAILAMLFFTQCNNDAPATEATTTEEQPETTPPTDDTTQQVTQIDEGSISPSEILKTNEAAYLALRKRVTSNLDTILNRVDRSTTNETLKEGIKNGFQEIVKYKTIYDMAKTSKYTSAETIEQFMSGMEFQLKQLEVK